MSKNDGGAAFPRAGSAGYAAVSGMSLRDYFAAKAMAALMSNSDVMNEAAEYCESDIDLMDVLAERSYVMADAMLKTREVAQ